MLGKRGRGTAASGRLGRGKANRPPPRPPLQHTRPVGQTRSRTIPNASTASTKRDDNEVVSNIGNVPEEIFRMVPGKGLDFGVIVRLVPGMVDVMRNAEERGGCVRIKFGSNFNDPSDNVIDVDGKEYRFTWSKDFGQLCDVYQEHRNDGEDGVLTECGSAWRKLNVQPGLDESVKNHVKKWSGAERLHTSRTAIVLDPRNSSVLRQSTASTGRPNLSFLKSVSKSQASNCQDVKCGKSPPLASPIDRHAFVDPTSLYGHGPAAADKYSDFCNKGLSNSSIHKLSYQLDEKKDKFIDLRSMLVTLLSENPKGMSLKTLERLVGEAMPNAVKNIESVIRNIATFHAPGRYFLKPKFGTEGSKKYSSEAERTATKINTLEKKTERNSNEHLVVEHNRTLRVDVSDMPIDTGNKNQLPDSFANCRNLNVDNEARICSFSQGERNASGTTDGGSDDRSPSQSQRSTDSRSVSSYSGSHGSFSNNDLEVDIVDNNDDNQDIGKNLMTKNIISSSFPKNSRPYSGAHKNNNTELCSKMVHRGQNIENLPIFEDVQNKEHTSENTTNNWFGGNENRPKPCFSSHYQELPEPINVFAAENGHTAPVDKVLYIENSESDHEQFQLFKGTPTIDIIRTSETKRSHGNNKSRSISPIKLPEESVKLRGNLIDKITIQNQLYELGVDNIKAKDPSHTTTSISIQRGSVATVKNKRKSIILKDHMDHENKDIPLSIDAKRMKSHPVEDVMFLLKFEKYKPEFCSPIKDYSQYKVYVKVYEEKYEIYLALSKHLEETRNEFLKIACDIHELSKVNDKDACDDCCTQIKEFRHQHRMIHIRLKKAFIVIYEELQNIKQRIQDFAEEYTRD